MNLYYGVSLTNALVNAIVKPSQIEVSSSAMGPVGLMGEVLLTKYIGLGFEYGLTKSELSYKEQSPIMGVFYSFRFNIAYTRIQMRANVHLSKGKFWDIYFLCNAGYSGIKTTYVTDDPYYIPDFKLSASSLGVKMGVGVRYFILKNLGFHSEIAIGTPILSGGLSFRI